MPQWLRAKTTAHCRERTRLLSSRSASRLGVEGSGGPAAFGLRAGGEFRGAVRIGEVTQLIVQNGRAAAVVGETRIYLAPHVAALPTAHPVRRRVLIKAMYALEIADGRLDGPYDDEVAERWARRVARDACAPGRRRSRSSLSALS